MASPSDEVAAYWLAHYGTPSGCGLCGNRGVIDTTGRAIDRKGRDVGGEHYCLCPNGQKMREKHERKRVIATK